ncbi:MAG: hypothetical protein A2X61_08070 [Ignavibacteria bacterium GWB2_35_12]|nr:MAG: hypothetical protein A2X61_08070 [Ignavibacteria bacterium GWB2_35_12]OGU92490.1 MAG: hypothetical protein A2220_11760 [Ignavibacteria bacterium RIFOXYA2_FULL_35_10]OGV20185.1 MAG: hypothetical protein A2475_15175 [Ignavibacteria bacterium RIFOXYC2_FULL_35_21]
MSIESVKIDSNVKPIDDTSTKLQTAKAGQQAETQPVKPTDTLSISEEVKNISPIMANINSDVYNKPEVLRDVALKLMQELYQEDTGTRV